MGNQQTIDAFHKLYYGTETTWTQLKFMGHKILKCPLDLWIYQEIFHDVRPDFIIETGTHSGGSTLYWASLCQLFQTGKVISIDIHPKAQPPHPLITYITADSIATETLKGVAAMIASSPISNPKVLVNLDSLHIYHHVCRELECYAPLVTPGSYLIVEDTNIPGHPVEWNRSAFGDKGPWDAATEFLHKHPEFVRDPSREKLFMTFNPGGYLKRVT